MTGTTPADLRDPRMREVMHVVSAPEAPVPIRRASRKDLSTFRSLWKGLVVDHARRGSSFGWQESALAAFYEPLFNAYTSGERKGVCLLAGLDLGVLLWGETLAPLPLPMRDGPVAQGWGTYVLPSHRGQKISEALRAAAGDCLRAQGFRRVFGTALLPKGARENLQALILQAAGDEAAALLSAAGAGFVLEEVSGSIYL